MRDVNYNTKTGQFEIGTPKGNLDRAGRGKYLIFYFKNFSKLLLWQKS